MKKIIIENYNNDGKVLARLDDNPACGSGKTIYEAVGHLVSLHGEMFDIEIEDLR